MLLGRKAPETPAPPPLPPSPSPPPQGGTPKAPPPPPPQGGTPKVPTPTPGGTPSPATGTWKWRLFSDGHPADPALPDDLYAEQNRLLADQTMLSWQIDLYADSLAAKGWAAAAMCMRLHAQTLAQGGGTPAPAPEPIPTSSGFSDGCPADANLPPEIKSGHEALLADDSAEAQSAEDFAAWEATGGFPLAASCMYRRAQYLKGL